MLMIMVFWVVLRLKVMMRMWLMVLTCLTLMMGNVQGTDSGREPRSDSDRSVATPPLLDSNASDSDSYTSKSTPCRKRQRRIERGRARGEPAAPGPARVRGQG